jgi:DNA-directed RNA polymerase specialized sigma24 family protein
MSTDELRAASLAQSACFLNNEPHDSRYAYELFRRAIVESDPLAWAAIVTDFRPLVVAAIRRQAGYRGFDDEDDWVNRTFERFWRAIRPHRLDQFPDTPALLRYLKTCASSVYLDYLRDQRRHGTITLQDADSADLVADRDALADHSAAELWWTIVGLLRDDQERAAAYFSLVQGMTPRDIRTHQPHLFETIEQVYQTKRRVLDRLRQAPELRAFVTEGR